MKKRILALTAALIMTAVFTGCGSSVPYDGYDLNDYIKVGKYKGLKTEGYHIEVSENDVEQYIDSALEAAPETKTLKDGEPVQDGDTLNIDYEGKIDGKKFEGGSNKGDELTLGSGKFIPGFEDGLIGRTIGDEAELNLTFPENYDSEKLKGKDVVFKVKINSATRQVTPEYTLDYIKKNTKFKSFEEYEKAVKEKLYKEKENEAVGKQKQELWAEVMEKTKVKKYPEKELEEYIKSANESFDAQAKQYGMSHKQFLNNNGIGSDKELKALIEENCKMSIKQEMAIKYIADKENLEYSDEEADRLVANLNNQGYGEEEIKAQMGIELDDYVYIALSYEKVFDFILKHADVTETGAK